MRETFLKKGEIIPLNTDFVFTSIFNNQENIEILEAFLSIYLDDNNIEGNLKVASRDLRLESMASRSKQVDLILYRGKDIINIELNNSFTPNLIERNVVYACNMHGGQLKYKDNSYREIKSTLQINLNASDKTHSKKLLEQYSLLEKESGIELSKKIQIDIINLQNYDKKCYTLREKKLARWSKLFLAKTDMELENVIGEDLMKKEVKEKLIEEVKRCSEDREFIELYSMYSKEELERNTILEDEKEEAREIGREIGLKQGLKEGRKEGLKKGRKEGLKEGKEKGNRRIKKIIY